MAKSKSKPKSPPPILPGARASRPEATPPTQAEVAKLVTEMILDTWVEIKEGYATSLKDTSDIASMLRESAETAITAQDKAVLAKAYCTLTQQRQTLLESRTVNFMASLKPLSQVIGMVLGGGAVVVETEPAPDGCVVEVIPPEFQAQYDAIVAKRKAQGESGGEA